MFTFAPFCPDSMPFDIVECRRKLRDAGGNMCRLVYGESLQKGTPPPLFGEQQVPSTPIIFRTKNTEKSRLGLIGKNFGKNLRENVSRERESPQSCGKGARVLKYERLVQI